MATDILMPKMGYDMETGKILRWLKAEGDTVTKGEPIAEIETDKIAIEIEAFASGILGKIGVPAGAEAPVGSPIGVILAVGEKAAALPKAKAITPKATAATPKATAPLPPVDRTPASLVRGAVATSEGPEPLAGERLKASPLARKVAEEKGVDLAGLTGSGPGGRIVRKDVEAAEPLSSAPAAAGTTEPLAAGGGKTVALSAMRRAIARRMTESKAPVPHFYVAMAVDMGAAMALREQLNVGRAKEERISVNDLIVKACALALRANPSLNAVFKGDAIFYPEEIAISVAVAIDDGLIAPDIHQADTKGVGAIASEIRDKAQRAKAGKLTPDEYGRGTFTVSNLGMFGVENFTAIITLPQSAAIAVGAVQAVAVVKDGQVVAGQVMRFTVSADHRVTDGAGSARFAAEVRRLLENPFQLLL